MGFSLDPDEDLVGGLRRVVREEAGAAVARLDAGAGGDEPVGPAVHAARKSVKRLRCVVRLLRPVLGRDLAAGTNEELRAAAGMLGPARDAAVMVELLEGETGDGGTADGGTGDGGSLVPPGALHGLCHRRDALEAVVRAGDGACAAARLRGVADGVTGWPLDVPAARLRAGLRDGLARVAEQERRRRSTAEDLRDDVGAVAHAGGAADGWAVLDEARHDWRKRVKDLWHASRLLAPTGPSGRATADLDALGDLLGDDHDAAVLSAALTLPPGTDGLVAVVRAGLPEEQDRSRLVARLAERRRAAEPAVADAVRRLALPPPQRLADAWTSGLPGGR